MAQIAPRITPPPSGAGRSTVRMPADVVADQVARLKLFTLTSGAMWGIGALMDGVVLPVTVGAMATRAAVLIETGGVAVSALLYLYVRYWPCTMDRKAGTGLWLMLLNSAGIALLENWATDPSVESMRHLSWIPIAIVFSAMITPGRPRPMLAAALVSASFGPLGVWLAHLRGVDVPSVLNTLVLATPNYTCAIAAVLPAKMFEQYGRRINEARALGSYELVDRLGAGGMGEVWRARHRLLARDAAVKLIRSEVLGSTPSGADHQIRRFEREAQATAALTSPHTIQLFDFGATDDGSFYYAMELLSGRDLESLVKEFGPLPPERAMYLLRQMCHSLGEAHALGLVHRDVKPANVFVCRMGLDYDFVKVLDFGLVQVRKTDPASAVTESLLTAQQLIGTPAYMAPEVILGQTEVDRRADVYALGCVMYYLLTGRRVFEDGTQMQTLVDHVHKEPAAPSRVATQPIPREIDRLVLDCLKKNPDDRPGDAGRVLARIRRERLDHAWSCGQAEEWWRAHLPELSGPVAASLKAEG